MTLIGILMCAAGWALIGVGSTIAFDQKFPITVLVGVCVLGTVYHLIGAYGEWTS